MKKLSEMSGKSVGKIISIDGDQRFLSRITSIGLTIGNEIEVVKNEKKQPVLIYGRDTLVAINRRECEHVMLEEVRI